MCLSDTAEYWWREPRMPYTGRDFKHNPNHKCSHYNPASGNVATTVYIGDINCYECIKNMDNDITLKIGLKKGNAPETFYMSIKGRKQYNAQKKFNEKYGLCSCGSIWRIRKNKSTGEQFLGCSSYPRCTKTKSLK
jgi:ssDNA-binding Zn-finger/Zn-ribbon topoisomerase 1